MIIVRHDVYRAAPRAPLAMRSPLSPRLTAGLLTLALWALVAGSALWWWLRVGQLSAPWRAPVAGAAPPVTAVDSAQVARALGAVPAAQAASAPAPDVAGRLALRGIVTYQGRGAALIAVDGKPARPLRVGATLEGVDGGWRLRSVSPHAAVLAADGRELRLEMPALARRSSAGDAVAPPRPPLPGQPAPGIPAAPLVPPTPPLPTTPPLSATPAPVLPVAPAVTPQPQAFVPPSAARND